MKRPTIAAWYDVPHAIRTMRSMACVISRSSAMSGEDDGAALGLHAPAHRVGGGARLLVDLLQHEVAVAALLGEDRIPLDADRGALDRRAVEMADLHSMARHHRQILVLEDDDVARVGEDGGDVGGEERLVLAEAHHHAARPLLGGDQAVRALLRQHDDGVGAAQLAERAPHRLVQARRVGEMPLDEMGDHLRVGLGAEAMALGLQALLDGQVVLDDAVVHDDEVARAVGVGMRVLVGGAAVGGPARVADADAAPQRTLAQEALQHLDAAGGAPDLQPLRADHRDARRIIAAVLELA